MVLNPFARIDQHIMDDSDLAGPILFLLLYGIFLALVSDRGLDRTRTRAKESTYSLAESQRDTSTGWWAPVCLAYIAYCPLCRHHSPKFPNNLATLSRRRPIMEARPRRTITVAISPVL